MLPDQITIINFSLANLILHCASCLTVSKKGEYVEEKWISEKKEFIKLHNIAVDEKSEKIVSFRIQKETYMIQNSLVLY